MLMRLTLHLPHEYVCWSARCLPQRPAILPRSRFLADLSGQRWDAVPALLSGSAGLRHNHPADFLRFQEFVGFDACIREIFLRPFELRVDLKRHLRIVQFILDDLFYSIFAFFCFTGFIYIHQFAQKLGKRIRCLPQNSGRDQGAGLTR